MKKVVINLSPQKHKAASFNVENLAAYIPLGTIVAIIGLAVILVLQTVVLKKSHSYAVKAKSWLQWEQKAKTLQDAKRQMSELNTKRDKLEQVVAPGYKMSPILENIFSSLPKNIWFQSLNFQEGSLVIEGYVVKWQQDYLASLDSFIKALRGQGYFSSKFSTIQIKQSQKTEFNNVEVIEFIIECKK